MIPVGIIAAKRAQNVVLSLKNYAPGWYSTTYFFRRDGALHRRSYDGYDFWTSEQPLVNQWVASGRSPTVGDSYEINLGFGDSWVPLTITRNLLLYDTSGMPTVSIRKIGTTQVLASALFGA